MILLTDQELGAELEAVARAAGHEVDVCAGEAEVWSACEKPTDVLVVDSSSDAADGVTLVDSMRAGGELHGVRTLAFHADDDAAAKERAQEVGFNVILPRAQMEADGAQLVARLLA